MAISYFNTWILNIYKKVTDFLSFCQNKYFSWLQNKTYSRKLSRSTIFSISHFIYVSSFCLYVEVYCSNNLLMYIQECNTLFNCSNMAIIIIGTNAYSMVFLLFSSCSILTVLYSMLLIALLFFLCLFCRTHFVATDLYLFKWMLIIKQINIKAIFRCFTLHLVPLLDRLFNWPAQTNSVGLICMHNPANAKWRPF